MYLPKPEFVIPDMYIFTFSFLPLGYHSFTTDCRAKLIRNIVRNEFNGNGKKKKKKKNGELEV